MQIFSQRLRKKILTYTSIFLLGVVVGASLASSGNLSLVESYLSLGEPAPSIQGTQTSRARVTKVIDGDTIKLDSGENIRFIGIDAPETSRGKECYADEATQFLKQLVENKQVTLIKDVSEADRFGRPLRYVMVIDENGSELFVNEVLVRGGYAEAASYPPDTAKDDILQQAEEEAKQEKKGLWNKCKS